MWQVISLDEVHAGFEDTTNIKGSRKSVTILAPDSLLLYNNERDIGHPDAEFDATRVADIRRRLTNSQDRPAAVEGREGKRE